MGFEYLVIAFFFGLATAIIGRGKGSSFWLWLLIGTLLPPLGLIAVILYRGEKDEPERQCPTCHKAVKLYVQVCPRCGTDLYLPDPPRFAIPASGERLPEPGADDRVGEADAVADDGGLLRVAVQPLLDGDRHLLGGDAALDRLDHELRGVELLLAQDQLGEDRGAHGAVAVGAVGDVGPGDAARRAG